MRDPITNEYIVNEWESVPCPICSSNDYTVYEKFGSRLQYRYIKCSHCTLVYCSPRPKYDQDFIDSCYARYFQFTETTTINDLRNIKTSSLSTFEKEIRHLVKFDKKNSHVLDIGSGMGSFLEAAKPFYQTLTGLDVSALMANFVKNEVGVNVLLEQFEDHISLNLYSLIHMSHVIEHIPNPNQWLQHAHKLLDPEGILVINVPNKMSYSNVIQHWLYKLKLKKQFSSSWDDPTRTPDHLYEPTVESFTRLIKQNNFEILDHYSYSRKDPASNSSLFSKWINRSLKIGSNLTFITRKKKEVR